MPQLFGESLIHFNRGEGYAGPRLCHYCPACGCLHDFAIDEHNSNGQIWKWNNSQLFPSFAPGMDIRLGPYPEDGHVDICNYTLTLGLITYFHNCTHALAGRIIPLPPIPAQYRRRCV